MYVGLRYREVRSNRGHVKHEASMFNIPPKQEQRSKKFRGARLSPPSKKTSAEHFLSRDVRIDERESTLPLRSKTNISASHLYPFHSS